MTDAFKKYWQDQVQLLKKVTLSYTCTQRKHMGEHAAYFDLTFISFDGEVIHAKYIRPLTKKKVPVVFDFHRYLEQSQGYFHLTRYVALQYAVVAMDCRGQGQIITNSQRLNATMLDSWVLDLASGNIDDIYYRKVYLDALLLSWIVEKLEGIDSTKMIAFGRDQGGAMALVLASLNPHIIKCSMLQPMLSNSKEILERQCVNEKHEWYSSFQKEKDKIISKLEYIDIMNFARLVHCDVLLATALLDTKAPSYSHQCLYDVMDCKKNMLTFVKHGHELINAFEDENLKFIIP